MHIGLIGGIGPAAQDYYTRQLIGMFASAGRLLEMTTAHADTPTLLHNLAAGRSADQAAIFARLAERLAKAGADIVAVTSIAGHFCASDFAALSPLPVVDMIETVADDIVRRGFARLGILGTRTVMESRFYGGLGAVTIIAPPEPALGHVHAAYAAMAIAGAITPSQQAVFESAARHLVDDGGAQAIILGGTDLALAFNADSATFAIIDCAAIHADAIARRAMAAS